MLTFLWVCLMTSIGAGIGGAGFTSPWLGALFGFAFSLLCWFAMKIGSSDTVGDVFESVGDSIGDSFDGGD